MTVTGHIRSFQVFLKKSRMQQKFPFAKGSLYIGESPKRGHSPVTTVCYFICKHQVFTRHRLMDVIPVESVETGRRNQVPVLPTLE